MIDRDAVDVEVVRLNELKQDKQHADTLAKKIGVLENQINSLTEKISPLVEDLLNKSTNKTKKEKV